MVRKRQEMKKEPNVDWIEEALIKRLDYCKYDIAAVFCPEPETKDCSNCPLNPDALPVY